MLNILKNWGLFVRNMLKQAAIGTLVESIAIFFKMVVSMLIEKMSEWEQRTRRSNSFYGVHENN